MERKRFMPDWKSCQLDQFSKLCGTCRANRQSTSYCAMYVLNTMNKLMKQVITVLGNWWPCSFSDWQILAKWSYYWNHKTGYRWRMIFPITIITIAFVGSDPKTTLARSFQAFKNNDMPNLYHVMVVLMWSETRGAENENNTDLHSTVREMKLSSTLGARSFTWRRWYRAAKMRDPFLRSGLRKVGEERKGGEERKCRSFLPSPECFRRLGMETWSKIIYGIFHRLPKVVINSKDTLNESLQSKADSFRTTYSKFHY